MGIQINGATDSITAIDGTIDVVSAIGNAGVVTATAFVGNITGNVTGNINHTSNLELQTGGVTRAHFNSSGHFAIAGITTMSGNLTIENAEPSIFFTDTNANPDYKIFNDSGALKIYDTTYNATRLQIGPTNGEVTIASNTYFPNGITMNPGTASVVNTIAQRLGNTTAKIRFPANDTFTVETTGSERLRINSAGISTFYNSQLHIEGAGSGNVPLTINTDVASNNSVHPLIQAYSDNATYKTQIGLVREGSSGALGWAFFTNAVGSPQERLRITSTGNLQFNTTANGQAVILKSTGNYYNKLSFDSGNTSAGGELAYIDFSWDGDKVADIYAEAGSDTTNKDDGHLVFRTSPQQGNIAERLRITSAGTVGINESSPSTVFHVKHHNNNSADITIEGGGSGNAGIQFLPGGQTNTYFAYVDTNRNFRIQDHTAERLRIIAGGKVLIGNGTYYTPQGMLHIVGDDNSNGPELYLQVGNNNTADNIGALVFGNNVDKSICMIRGSTHTANNTGDIEFHTSTTGSMSEKLRIKNDGVINIGVASPQYAKKVNIQGDNGYTLSLSNQDYTGHAAGTFSGIEGRIECGGSVWSSAGVRFVKDNGTSGDKHTRLELYAVDGYSSKIGLIVNPDGEVSHPLQPSCTLYAPHAGQQINVAGDDVPIGYSQIEHNTRMTISNGGSSDSTRVNSRIQVPIAGRYLVSSLMSGSLNGSSAVDANDGIVWYLKKNGGTYSSPYNNMFGWDTLGEVTGEEFEMSFTVVLSLAANDYLEVAYTNIHTNFNVNLDKGYFSVHKLS